MRRREFLRSGSAAAALALATSCSDGAPRAPATDRVRGDDQRLWRMPDEGARHQRTWMAFGASAAIWGRSLAPQVRRQLATIAQTIAEFEPVSMLVPAHDRERARKLVGSRVELVEAPLDDLWIRDTGPVFVTGNAGLAAVDFNFNGWGGKQEHQLDAAVAGVVAAHTGAELLSTDLVLEGGGIEVDGAGTALITESCVLNANRNPGWSKADVEAELGPLLGLEKIIWLPGIAGKDITDGHTDFYARFARPGVVVAGYDADPRSWDHDVTVRHREILDTAADARGHRLEVVILTAPGSVRPQLDSENFAAGYTNFYLCNGAVIAPEFGDPEADEAAENELARLFGDRTVVQLDIDAIAAGGGGIHCATQQQPAG